MIDKWLANIKNYTFRLCDLLSKLYEKFLCVFAFGNGELVHENGQTFLVLLHFIMQIRVGIFQ